jgi:hypothetical protein
VGKVLDPESLQKLTEIVKDYIARHGFKGVYERLNERSVAQIFAEYRPADLEPIASGDVDGVHYELHKVPQPESAEGPGDSAR